jgi:membrane protease YdiL (CAAX protease family)
MNDIKTKHYPTILGAIHLIVLYTFIQTIVDFPLALIDYYNGTDYLYNPIKKIVLGLGSTLFIFYFAYKKARVPLKELFPGKKFNVLVVIPILFFLWAAQNLIGEVNIALDKALPPPVWFWELFNKIFESDFGIYGAILKVVIMAPVIEELIFRGIIMHGLMRNYSRFTAVFVSALLFALFHLNPWQFPATFVLGLILGILMVRTRNIFLCILGHAINNGLVLISIQNWDEIQKTSFFQSSKPNQLIISTLISASAFLLIIFLSKTRKQKSN